jgi:glycosyltransferase involved in cell wall biosynthesis
VIYLGVIVDSTVQSSRMKLIIQIPCFNEAETLSIALSALPRTVPGFDFVEWLIIDDGSQDDTVNVAKAHGVDHVVRHFGNKGLARAFMTGLETSLRLGADVIVNTDADNQYNADDIPALVQPILEHRAEIVVGARPIETIEHFSPIKKLLQRLGSWVVRVASKTDIPDAPSGFRAMSRAAAQKLMVFNDYTYTLETIIQAGQKNMAIVSVPIRVNGDLRPSRLVKSIPSYIKSMKKTMILLAIIIFVALLGLALSGSIMSNVEQAKYTVIKKQANIEIRDYPPMIVAQVALSGDRKNAIREGFQVIANYIFGNNISAAKVKMTAPVTQQKNEKIAMTAPVIQAADGKSWIIRFVMPTSFTMETLPKPKNDSVKIKEMSESRYAVIRFSGMAGRQSLQKNTAALDSFIKTNHLKSISQPIYAFFNPPWTLPFLRRNEIMIEVQSLFDPTPF